MNKSLVLRNTVFTAFALFASSSCGQARGGEEADFLPDQIVPLNAVISEEKGELVYFGDGHSAISTDPAETEANPRKFRLAEEATRLAKLSQTNYLKLQKSTVGSSFPACNYFLITSLCKAGYCEEGKPFFRAASFDGYFRTNGWMEMSISNVKAWLEEGRDFDVVFQRDGKSRGHVMVAIGVTADGRIRFAQGNHGRATNEIISWGVDSLKSQGFRAFTRF